MAKAKNVLISLLIIFTLFFIAAAVSVSLFGKKIAEEQLEKNLKKEVNIGSISFALPFIIRISDLEIGDFFSAERVSFSPNPLGFLGGKVILSGVALVSPAINIVKNSDGSTNLPVFKKGGKQPQIILTGLSVKNGRLVYSDKKITPEGFITEVDQVNIEISKVALPLFSLKAKFRMSGLVAQPQGEVLGALKFNGWADFRSKDMDAELEVSDLNIAYFSPYYGDFFSGRKLLSAKLNLKSSLKSKDNDFKIDTGLVLSDLVYAQKEVLEEEPKVDLNELFRNTLDLFADENGNIKLKFAISTSFDNPRISISSLKKAMLEAAAKNLFSQRPQSVIDKVGSIVEQFKALRKAPKEKQAQ